MFFNFFNNINETNTTLIIDTDKEIEQTTLHGEQIEHDEQGEEDKQDEQGEQQIDHGKKSFFNHLNENECSYIDHFTNALKYSSISLKASFYFFIHAIFPDFYIDNGSKTINSLNKIIINHTYIVNKNTNVTEIQLEQVDR
jgi:hypothetical protein